LKDPRIHRSNVSERLLMSGSLPKRDMLCK
jgi:hypothetical protein